MKTPLLCVLAALTSISLLAGCKGGGTVPRIPLGSMQDNNGHGSDVAGIAGAAGNNGVGFAGVAYAAPLMIFRVFPDPPAGVGCPPQSTDPNCEANVTDVAKTIDDAVRHGAAVINLSLGSAPPEDPSEAAAVANAIANNVVVVAASGNDGASTLDVPAADAGVIAVGASGLRDPARGPITEAVAGFSNYDSTNASWGLVAPGGNATNTSDADDLHWIDNIWTSTAADGSSTQACVADPSGTTLCRVFLAGTSQATPHVAGAAALLLSAGAAPSNIKNLLCSSARPLNTMAAGCGRLDVYKAMALALGDSSVPRANSLVCGISGNPQFVARRSARAGAMRRTFAVWRKEPENVPGVIEAVYDRASLRASRPQIFALATRIGAEVSSELDVPSKGETVAVLRVPPGQEEATIAQLRSSGLVHSAVRATYRHALTTTAFMPNDPLFGGTAPDNVPPLYESSGSEGQWDNHVICAANAWGYGNANSTGQTFSGALGGNVPIAIIDTGADLTNPELAGRVTYAETVLNGKVTVDKI